MTPKDDRVHAFLTDLKHQREAARRLFEKAVENPDLVLAYIEALPKGWETLEDEEVLVLIRLRKAALAALRAKEGG